MQQLFELIKTTIEENSRDYPIRSIVQCGSSAKGTSTDNSDIDVFVCFDLSYHWDNFAPYIQNLAPKLFHEYEIKHASYPYIEANVVGQDLDVRVNVVPCYHTDSVAQVQSPVDRSPHHVTWVNTHLNKGQKEHVKQLKEFLKLEGLYGADNNTKGFSGYLCEVIIWTFHSLAEVFNAYAFTEETDFTKPPFYFADPIDPRRHLSAAVSPENWGKLIVACRKKLGHYLPEIESVEIEDLHELLKDNLVTVVLPFEELPKIRKETKKMETRLTKAGFNVLWTDSQPYLAVLLFEHKKLSGVYKQNDIIGLTRPKAHINISKINSNNVMKFIVTNKLTLSAIKVRVPFTAEEILESDGYNCQPCKLSNYSYKKALSQFI